MEPMDDELDQFLLSISERANRHNMGITIIQNFHTTVYEKNPLMDMINMSMEMKLKEQFMKSLNAITDQSSNNNILLLEDNKNEENIKYVEVEDTHLIENTFITCSNGISIPYLTLHRTSDWKEYVYENKLLKHETMAIISLVYTINKIEKTNITIYFKDIEEYFNIYNELLTLNFINDLYVIIEPKYSKENEIVINNKDAYIPELVHYYTIFSDKPKCCQINPIEFNWGKKVLDYPPPY